MAQSGYGSYKYESPEARALGTITSESYDKDQAKNLIKLNNDVSYMAAYMRKMQKGIDDANQNVIQQIQSFINDIVVLIGGGSAQGFDFGDLRYILQMIGALLGIGEQDFPLSAFESAWHMLSTYIFPSAQFEDVINALIDSAIGGILDLFGEVPIAGEALQQLAAVILSVRDFFSSFDLSHLVISISQLADQSPTVIWEGGFDTATTIPEGFGFAWDASGETSPFGSAVAVGDGTEKAIFSNIFEVGKKQVFDFRTAVWFSNASNSGSDAVVIELVPYDENNVVGTPVKIAGISPSANSSGWVVMQGNYTIPNSGWSKAVARIRVTNKLTAGTIKFDNAKVTRTQKILQEWVDGLAQALSDIVDWIENLVDELLDAIGLGGGIGGLFDKIQDLATGIGEWLLDTEDVSAGLSDLAAEANQIRDILAGIVVTPINSAIQDIKDWWTDVQGRTQHLTSGGQLSASNLTNQDALDIVAAVRDGAGDIANTFTDGVKDAYDNLRDLFGFMVEARDIALTAQQQLQDITNDTEAPPELNGMSWSTTFGGTLDSALPGGDWSGSSELVIKESGHVGLAGSAAFNNHYWKVTAQAFLTSGQSASIVLGPGKGKDGHLYRTGVYVNCNSTFTSAAYAHITSGSIYFGQMTRSGSVFTFNQLAFVSGAFKVGDLARLRYHGGTYHVVVNGITKLQFTDSGNVIPTGAGYDRAGFSEQKSQEFSDWFSSWHYESWRVAGFAMSDWLPIGVNVTTASWRLRRGAGGEVALSVGHGAQAAMPDGFYGVQDLSSGVTVTDLGSGQVTITEAGWYEISATSINRDNFSQTPGTDTGIKNAGDNTESWRASPWVLFVDGVAIAGPIMAGVSTTVYLGAGQTVRPGVSAASPLGGAGSFASSGGPQGAAEWRSQGYRGRSAISHVSGAPSASFTGRKVAT